MPFPRRRAPWWFLIAVSIGVGLALRALGGAIGGAALPPGSPAPPSAAFLFFLILIGQLIWKGLEISGRVTLEILRWFVINLSLVVTKLKNGLGLLGADLLKALKRAWDFTRRVYDEVLKPAWDHFWNWFDKFRRWLDDTIGPVLDWLRTLRDNLIGFWKLYVRPWLDLIDVTRKLLRVLAALHIPFARELDRRLGRLEEQIEKPFRFVLAKINEVIGIVNRVITLDGLIQRLALIRSIERDYVYAWRSIVNPWRRALTDDERKKGEDGKDPAIVAAVARSTAAYMRDRGGPDGPLFTEMAAQWRIYFRASGR